MSVPVELRELPQWVCWRSEVRDGKRTKVPYRADGSGHASTTNSATWTTFEAANAAARSFDGIGFVFSPDDPYVGVDLDELDADAGAIILALDSYTEHSVSGDGAHVIVRASLNGHPRNRKGPLEIYGEGRYFVFTGQHMKGTPETIEDRQDQLEKVLAHFLPEPERKQVTRPSQPVDLDDQELLELMFAGGNGDKIRRLWDGDTSAHEDNHSRADAALLAHLAFYTRCDPMRMERMFSSSGLGQRDKWTERDDYRTRSVEFAISGCSEGYEPFARNEVPANPLGKPLPERHPPSVTSLKKTRGVPTDIPGKCDLAAVLSAFEELLVLPDPGAVEIALAAIVANYADGDAVWPLLVGPPGCGKSEIVTAMTDAPAVWSLSSLTPQTLLSGFERKGKAAKDAPPASMLLQIGPFGILAFKDLTTVLTMHREARAQIIGQLREVADGKTEKSFGNGLRIEWEGKLGMLAGVTPVIDEQHAFLSVMGERFVLYRMPEVARREIAARALARRAREKELRDRIREMVATFLSGYRNVGRLELPEKFTEPLITLADIVTRARSGVARDYQTRDILYLPEPEAPTRLAKHVAQLMAAMLAIGVEEGEAWKLAQKIGWDSVPAIRTALIRLLGRMEGMPQTMAELQEQTGLPPTTVNRTVEDLVVLGLAKRAKDESGKWKVWESRLAGEYWDSDKGPTEADDDIPLEPEGLPF